MVVSFFFFFKATQGGGAGREAYDWAGASLGWRPTRARASQGWAVAPNPYLGEARSRPPLQAGTSPAWHFLPPSLSFCTRLPKDTLGGGWWGPLSLFSLLTGA